MEQYPLTDARHKIGDQYTLPILLIGSGSNLNMLRDNVLANGQLLKTALQVYVASPSPVEDRNALIDKAPDLTRFIRVTDIDDSRLEDDWGTLTYRSCDMTVSGLDAIRDVIDICSYVLISTGSTETNRELAGCLSSEKDRLVAYVQKDGDAEELCWPKRPTHSSVLRKFKDTYMSEMEAVAYNLHYAYMRGNDPHVSTQKISDTFYEDYNYESNFECALHIRSKLQCCGLDTTYLKRAVEQFAKLLDEDHANNDDRLLNSLARLEHQRWCVSKLLQGFIKPDSLEQIYSAPDITTHSKRKDDKWHIALVGYADSDAYRPHLDEADWIAGDPTAISDLDALDLQTLLVHKKCGEIAARTYGSCQEAVGKLKAIADDSTQLLTYDLDKALEHLHKGEINAVRSYNNSIDSLKSALTGREDAAATEMLSLIDHLRCNVGAWIEYVSQKDYKEQNRILVRQIPFALSVGKNMVLLKLMSDDEDECVSAIWNLEPSEVLFLDYADSMDELIRIRRRSLRLNSFLSKHCPDVYISHHLYVSGDVRTIKDSYEEFFSKWNCLVQPLASGDADQIRPWFVSLIDTFAVNYIDMTGGKPELIGVAEEYARNSHVGTFVVRDSKIRNYHGAEGLKDQMLIKAFSVPGMFDHKGAHKEKDDDGAITGVILDKYEAFWQVANKNTAHWYNFCISFFAPAYREMLEITKKKKELPLDIPKTYLDDRAEEMMKDAKKKKYNVQAYWNILDELAEKGLVTKKADSYQIASQDILSALRNSGKVLEYYIYCAAREQFGAGQVSMSWMFSHDAEDTDSAQNELDVICTTDTGSLFISAKNVSLKTVKNGNFLNYVCYEVSELAEHFGINAKKVLAAPNVPQFSEDGKLSELVQHAMKRGVYLLGDACFACEKEKFNSDKLRRVLENIARGEEKWYKCLPIKTGTAM